MLPITAAHKDKNDQELYNTDTGPNVSKSFVYEGFYGPVLFFYPMQDRDDDADKHDIPGDGMQFCADDDFEGVLEQGADKYQPTP